VIVFRFWESGFEVFQFCGWLLKCCAGYSQMKTHYQILKVSEDAPDEVIRAAWRALSMRHHPDLNPSDPGAPELMQQLNEAYAVLGDKARRHAYDIRLAVVRASAQNVSPPQPQPKMPRAQPPQPPQVKPVASGMRITGQDAALTFSLALVSMFILLTMDVEARRSTPIFLGSLLGRTLGLWGLSGVAVFLSKRENAARNWRITLIVLAVLFLGGALVSPPKAVTLRGGMPAAPMATAAPSWVPPRPVYVRPTTTPIGHPWPQLSGYLPSAPLLATGGECEVTVDNSRRSGDVYVKLMDHSYGRVEKVRECFIRGGDWLKMPGVRRGQYEVRYMDLDTGQAAKSEVFELVQTETGATSLTLTLYLVPNGNTHLKPLAEGEF
jgi:hypothetical protein